MTYQQHQRANEARAMRKKLQERVVRHAFTHRYEHPKWMSILLALSYGASLRMAFNIGMHA